MPILFTFGVCVFILFLLFIVIMAKDVAKDATFEEIKDLKNHPDKLLIDVREPSELEKTGRIPNSINIPLNEVKKAFSAQLLEEEFKQLYGIKKPYAEKEIIFSCQSGRRAQTACETVAELGFTKGFSTVKVLEKELKLSPEAFNWKHGRELPSLETELIFSCLSGRRAEIATKTALDMGFIGARCYKGSWNEWAEKEGLDSKNK